MHPAARDALEDDALGGAEGDGEVDGDEGVERGGLCGGPGVAVEDEGGGRVVRGQGGEGGRGVVADEGCEVGGAVVVSRRRGGVGSDVCRFRAERHDLGAAAEQPPSRLELVGDEA